MAQKISLEKSLAAYRVMNTPTQYSWKQHYVNESFSNIDLLKCTPTERIQFAKRLEESNCTICKGIQSTKGSICTFKDLIRTIVNPDNKNIAKTNRCVIYSSPNGVRPVGSEAWNLWNGFQVIDMDIKNRDLARKLKSHIFNCLHKCNWFLGVTLSSSGLGLHVYTKISLPESEKKNTTDKKLLFYTNFRHKYSFVYLACVSAMNKYKYSKEDIVKWMDLHMSKPSQGAFIGYDNHPLINSGFFEDFIYVNFDSVEEIGHPDADWIAYPELKEVFKKWDFLDDESDKLDIKLLDCPLRKVDLGNKVHYKHYERWRLANTLVKLYGMKQGYAYLRSICSNNVKDAELQADCKTANAHKKDIDTWAVNRLNSQHGFKIKLNIENKEFDESDIFASMNEISNPTIINESKISKTYHITANQYLGDIRHELLRDCGKITLIEAGAGVGKTEMVKKLVQKDKKKIMMVMPFTSTIKSKVETDKNWDYSYGNKKPNLNTTKGLSLTIDKFSHLNLMDVKIAGFDYIFIDESHLMFQSEYRPVMAKVIELIGTSEVPIILMSGTPSGELVFFPDIVHLKIIKDDTRKKEFKINIVNTPSDLMFQMCRQMANDISNGKRVLFPTNKGTLYSGQIKAGVTYFLKNEHADFSEVNLQYYKKSNIGEGFMDNINFKKTINDTQILLCSNYLSVGVDILDKYNFNIYFADLMMPQEVEQFANRLRNRDLYINLYISKKDGDNNDKSINSYKKMNFKLNDDELRNVHSILRLCNAMIERNPIEYRYNSLISSIIRNNKFIEYNDIDNKYFLNEIAYKVIYFERKYREYVQQLPVLMKGMESYGYLVSSKDWGEFHMEGQESFTDLKTMVKIAYDETIKLNTSLVEELMDDITEDKLDVYKSVLKGQYDIKKGNKWAFDTCNKKLIVKNIEVFEKVVPIFISLTKQYSVSSVKEIFEFCRSKNKKFNFAAIGRIRTLVNIIYNNKKNRLDLPIEKFMKETYKFADRSKVKKEELCKFISGFAQRYAEKESTNKIFIQQSNITMDMLNKTFEQIFKCLVNTSRPNKQGIIKISKVELLWKEREHYNSEDHNKNLYILNDFLDTTIIDTETVEDAIL